LLYCIILAEKFNAMKKTAPIIAANGVFLLLLAFGCAPAYVPNVLPAPMLEQKGEMVFNVHTGIAGFDPQFALGITDHVGLLVNGSFRNYTSDSTDNFHQHLFFETGAGYFTPLGKAGRFEVFAGGGYGRLKAEFDNPLFESFADVNCMRSFVQPTIGFVTDVAELSLSTRFVTVLLKQGDQTAFAPFVEPAFTLKLGYRQVKGVAQMGLSLPLREQLDFLYQPFIFSLGLQVRLNTGLFNSPVNNSPAALFSL